MMKTGRHRKVNKRIAAGDVAEFGTPRKHTRMTEMDKLRMFVNERLTAAAEDIVGVFGETIAQYRAEIDRQRKELEKLRPKVKQQTSEPSASVENGCGSNGGSMPFTDPVSVRHQSSGISSQRMKVEPDVEDSDPARDPEPGSEGQPLSPEPGSEGQPLSPEPGSEGQPLSPDCSESRAEDSDEDWKETRGRRKPAKTTNRIKGVSPALLPDISCKVCGESFPTAALLAAHADRHANDCGVCGKRLETGDDIRRHLQLHKDKPYCCSLCSQSYANVHNLRIHLLVHSGLKPYACTVCNKRFARKGSLVRHVRTHSGEKRFGCPFCGRAFLEKANMKVHLRIHTGERPYWCSSCDRHFIQQSCFDRHACRRKRTLKGTDSHIQTTQ